MVLPHPIAELFPPITEEAFDELAKDISAMGQREPIVLFEGKILDGRGRYRACLAIGRIPEFVEFTGPSPEAFVVAANLPRCNLTLAERAFIAARLAALPPGSRADLAKKRNEPRVGTLSQIDAAKLLSVHRTTVQFARAVLVHGTEEEIAGIKAGTISVVMTGRAINKRRTPEERATARALPQRQRGANAQRFSAQRFDADLWGHLRGALTSLSGLPNPAEMTRVARRFDRTGLVGRTLETAIKWLTEFEDAYTRD
jgi:hypothetical protein